jgi:hypothetical protein
LEKTAAPVNSTTNCNASGRTEIPNPFRPVSLNQSGSRNGAVHLSDSSEENMIGTSQSRGFLHHCDQYNIIH